MRTNMSVYGVYTVRDVKGDYCLPPFVARNDEVAKRMIVDTIDRTPNLPMAVYGEDFRLVHIADYAEITGEIVPLPHVDLGDCRYIHTLACKRAHAPVSDLTGDDEEVPHD